MTDQTNRSAEPDSTAGKPYVRPALTLVGNLSDLLASGGTQQSDQGVCVSGGVDVDPTC
jgi:hypothetical protein